MKMHRKLRCVLDVLYHLHGFTEFQSCISRIFFLCYPLTGDQVYKLFMFFFCLTQREIPGPPLPLNTHFKD